MIDGGELSALLGGTGGGALVTYLIISLTKRQEAADSQERKAAREAAANTEAEFKAEVRQSLKHLLDLANKQDTSTQLHSREISDLRSRMTGLEVRQEKQAEAHIAAIEKLSRVRADRTKARKP